MTDARETHSPTPWKIEKHPNSLTSDYPIFDMDGEYLGDIDNKKDAQHIVKCVNSHDDLVQTLKEILIIARHEDFLCRDTVMEITQEALKTAGAL